MFFESISTRNILKNGTISQMLLNLISNLNEDIPAGGALVKNNKVSARNAKYA